jgi:hypothetical protein
VLTREACGILDAIRRCIEGERGHFMLGLYSPGKHDRGEDRSVGPGTFRG